MRVVDDLSRTTLFVLVILTLLVSILGTWTVLTQVDGGVAPLPSTSSQSSGEVGFSITHARDPPSTEATGRVAFGIRS